jgi:hypothetical protein
MEGEGFIRVSTDYCLRTRAAESNVTSQCPVVSPSLQRTFIRQRSLHGLALYLPRVEFPSKSSHVDLSNSSILERPLAEPQIWSSTCGRSVYPPTDGLSPTSARI